MILIGIIISIFLAVTSVETLVSFFTHFEKSDDPDYPRDHGAGIGMILTVIFTMWGEFYKRFRTHVSRRRKQFYVTRLSSLFRVS